MDALKKHQAVLLELLREFDRVCKKHDIPYVVFCGSALGAVRHKGFIPWDDDLDVCLLREDYRRLLELPATEWNDAYYLQAEFSDHWPMYFSKLRKNHTTCLEKFHPKDNRMHQGIYIDVFPCDNASDKAWVRKLQFYASRVVLAKSLDRRGYESDSKGKKLFMALCRLLPMKPFHKFASGAKKKDSKYVHTFLACTSKPKKGTYRRTWFAERVDMDFEDMKAPVSAHYDELLTTMYGDYMTIPKEEDRKCKVHAILVDTERDYTEFEHYRDGMTWDVYTRNIH